MKIIVCLDDHDGMLFAGRRQSKDSVLRRRVLELVSDGILWMNAYTAGQFEEQGSIRCDEDFLEKAAAGDYCFVENVDVTPYLHKIRGVILYRWNRRYPADVTFPVSLFADRWQLESRVDFPGSSHESITEERYIL